MTRHAENTLGSSSIAKIFDFALAVAATKAVGTEGLVAGEDG